MLYKASDIDFTVGTPVISRAQKFIIPVPADKENAEPLVYPIEAGEKAGKPITDWEGNIREGEGVVFYNYADKSWQAVAASIRIKLRNGIG